MNSYFYEKSGVGSAFLVYYKVMINGEKLGAFIVPTGIGASIGGYAGDASVWARKFAKYSKLIVNPNVVNAGCFSGITDKMLYVEGYSLDEFVKGNINLLPSENNKIGIIYDKAIGQDVLNVHINTANAVKTVYGVDVAEYTITGRPVGITFAMDENGISNGGVEYPEELLKSAQALIDKGCEAIAIVCLFENPDDMNDDYANGEGTDPVGGVEAIISHYISQKLQIPCAHSPAFTDYQIDSDVVNPKAAAEYITPTFLPCILLGLSQAPKLVKEDDISVRNLDYVVVPYDSMGSPAVFAAIENKVPVYAVRENVTALDITPDKLGISEQVIVVDTYEECLCCING